MSTIGRNDPCPCGSGKKYKHCHLKAAGGSGTSGPPASPFDKLTFKYNSLGIVATLAALQLDPANHGRNGRIEDLMRRALRYYRDSDDRPDVPVRELRLVIEQYTDGISQEDPLSNFFTENVAFENGNSTVMSGLYADYARILNCFSDAIFRQVNRLPASFKALCRDAIGVLLGLSEAATKQAGLVPLLDGDDGSENIVVPPANKLTECREALSFNKGWLQKFCEKRNYDYHVLSDFILQPGDPALASDDPEENIVNRKPFLDLGAQLLLYMPTGLPSALVEYIYTTAAAQSCTAELLETFQERKIFLCRQAVEQLGWNRIDIELPSVPPGLPVQEAIYQFDNEKLAYLVFIQTAENQKPDPITGELQTRMNQRVADIVQLLTGAEPKQPHAVFTLFIPIEAGRDYMFMWNKPEQGHETLTLKDEDLLRIAFADKVDRLTLWKFAKCYRRTNELTRIMSPSSMIDAFAVYHGNDGSLLHSDEANPIGGMLWIPPGTGDKFSRAVDKKKNEHAVRLSHQGRLAFATVHRYKNYAPIYIETDVSKDFRIVIEAYQAPIWIINRQTSIFRETWASYACEAIAFWLLKVAPDLCPLMDESKHLLQLEIDVEVEGTLIGEDNFQIDEVPVHEIALDCTIEGRTIKINIPYTFLNAVILPDNTADKMLLRSTLDGIVRYLNGRAVPHGINPAVIDQVIGSRLANPRAKMLLFSDATHNIKKDSRHLPRLRYVQSADISFILDNLVSQLPANTQVPARITSKSDKIKLCTAIVATLLRQLEAKIAVFDGPGLVQWLIKFHEKYIQQKEFREILIPARIACFSDVDTEIERLLDAEQDLAAAGHSFRTLIEFVASCPPTGTKWPNFDDVDELLALTYLVTTWGSRDESMRFNLNDPEMGLLPSGRIGYDRDFERQQLQHYSRAKVKSEVFRDMEDFEKNYYRSEKPGDVSEDSDPVALDQAFESEHDCTFADLCDVARALVTYGSEKVRPCMALSEPEMLALIVKNTDLSEDKVRAVLNLWTLLPREAIAKSPDGYTTADIMIWHYNRALSPIRRPLVKMATSNGPMYYYGYRQIVFCVDHLVYLLYTAKYPDAHSAALKSWLASVSGEKGNPFRERVRQWFEQETDFLVIPHEIKMSPVAGSGHLQADEDLGDIDLLVIDRSARTVYPLECKNVGGARNIHEMKVEVDTYLGRAAQDPDAKINKHLRRHEWLDANKAALGAFVEQPESYGIRSIVLTADELSLAYLKSRTLPLPVRSFIFLRKEGVGYLM